MTKRVAPALLTLAAAALVGSCTGQDKTAVAKHAPSGVGLPRIDSDRAMRYVREIVGIGSRPVGSPGHVKEEAYIRKHLAGDNVEDDTFTTSTPAGSFSMTNIIAKYPGAKNGIIVIGSHYDTNYPLKNFVGANDGGSSTGLLLELSNHLRGRSRAGYSVWLVFFDGEEAFEHWSETDSVYGSRHLATKWGTDGTAKKIKAFLLADMIGDRDLNIEREANSDPWLLDLVGQAASDLTYRSYFYGREVAIEDDHLPFKKVGVPVVDLIDLDYGFNNVFHHTTEDTLDKLSPKSLQITGSVILRTIQLLNAR